ncbi:sensor histidine kinase [Photobacterium angustum]|uniref:sensor histidine kinase n=1 Tax=Photobacterium angustum TaxID=661 RepID=UPI00069BD782|nr:sensor histidine kinase [Photobacterium angustum]
MSVSNVIQGKHRLPLHKQSLVFRLFSYFTVGLLLILGLQNLAEIALVKTMLHVPQHVQQDIMKMATDVEPLLTENGDPQRLAQWESKQKYYAFALNSDNKEISTRVMHPHFKFKLKFARPLNSILDSRVNQPIFMIPLKNGNKLMVQLPHELHPAKNFSLYFGLIQVVIAILITLMFSLIIARYLQRPLDTLRQASRTLANGDFSVRVAHVMGDKVKEFNELATDFDNMANQIQLLTEKQRRLIRDVSHELRTPLARHNLSLHLIRKRTSSEHLHLVDRLEQESEEMNELVTEILEFSQFENAKANIKLIPVDVQTFCDSTVEQCLQLKAHGQSLIKDIDRTLPMVQTDARLLVRAIKNLIGNAIKYAGSEANIIIHTSIRTNTEKSYVVVSVSDDGDGIPKQHLKHIFDPFTRIEGARDKQSGGYGLGLAIVKEAMQVTGGQVEAGRSVDGGLKISLLLPVTETTKK